MWSELPVEVMEVRIITMPQRHLDRFIGRKELGVNASNALQRKRIKCNKLRKTPWSAWLVGLGWPISVLYDSMRKIVFYA